MTVIESGVASFLSALLSGSRRRWTRPSLALRMVSRCRVRMPGTAASWQTAVPVFSRARGSSRHAYFRTTHRRKRNEAPLEPLDVEVTEFDAAVVALQADVPLRA